MRRNAHFDSQTTRKRSSVDVWGRRNVPMLKMGESEFECARRDCRETISSFVERFALVLMYVAKTFRRSWAQEPMGGRHGSWREVSSSAETQREREGGRQRGGEGREGERGRNGGRRRERFLVFAFREPGKGSRQKGGRKPHLWRHMDRYPTHPAHPSTSSGSSVPKLGGHQIT